jgi:hypothetical protein
VRPRMPRANRGVHRHLDVRHHGPGRESQPEPLRGRGARPRRHRSRPALSGVGPGRSGGSGHACGWCTRSGAFPVPGDLSAVAGAVAVALGVLHPRRLVHRDLAPASQHVLWRLLCGSVRQRHSSPPTSSWWWRTSGGRRTSQSRRGSPWPREPRGTPRRGRERLTRPSTTGPTSGLPARWSSGRPRTSERTGRQ